jgi:hypothetical protein
MVSPALKERVFGVGIIVVGATPQSRKDWGIVAEATISRKETGMPYSPFFQTLHDETAPVGHLGRGTHYSVLRVPTWHDSHLRTLPKAALLDFAVIWDEDHDTRVIDVVKEMYFEGILAPVRFIGERKGVLTVLLDPALLADWGKEAFSSLFAHIERATQHLEDNDSWSAYMDFVGGRDHSIISDKHEDVTLYLKNIQMLWNLGMKPNRDAKAEMQHLVAVAPPQ